MKEFDPKREFLFDYITVVAECTFAICSDRQSFCKK